MILNLVLAMTLASAPQVDSLQVQLIGNAGVRLSDGQTTVLIDLPYVSGSFGYQTWDSAGLVLVGPVVAAFTHAHDDHFDPRGLRRGWLVMGGDAVIAGTGDGFETTQADVTVGEFSVTALPTPHSPGHRSYRVEWRGRSLYFTGDTEDAAVLGHQGGLDVLFTTPWHSCEMAQTGVEVSGVDVRAYHLATDGSDRLCSGAVAMAQGSSLVLYPTAG